MNDELYNKQWFDKMSIDNVEFAKNEVGIHVFARRHHCHLFRLPVSFFVKPDFFPRIHEMAEDAWSKPRSIDNAVCPNCQSSKQNWARRYESRVFCGRCGKDYPTWPGKQP